MEAVADQPKVLMGNPGVLVVDPEKGCPCPLCRDARAQPSTVLADWKRGTLEWVNMLRTEWGFPALTELPPGRRNNKHDCVVARALGPVARSVPGFVVVLENGHEIPTPLHVLAFVKAFDAGVYPELAVASA